MKIENYEEGQYKTLTYSNFCTTEIFDYEQAILKNNSINPYLERLGKNITLSSLSKHIKWIPKRWNLDIHDRQLEMLRLHFKYSTHKDHYSGIYRKKHYDNTFYLKKSRDNYISDIKMFYSIFNNNDVNKKLRYYFAWSSCNWGLALPKAISFLKHYVNGWVDEKIELYYTYAYHKWNQTKNVYLHQSIKGESPYVFWDFRVVKNYKKVQKETQIEKVMTTKQLREKLINGYILCFMFNGLNVEIKPPVSASSHTASYNFSQSIFINGKPLNTLDTKSEEYKEWWGKNNGTDYPYYYSFKEHLYDLLNPRINHTFSEDPNRVLSQYIYNIRATKLGENHFYTISYNSKKDNKDNIILSILDIKKEILREFTKERAITAFTLRTHIYEDKIINIQPNGT